jgi:hypothetical protein
LKKFHLLVLLIFFLTVSIGSANPVNAQRMKPRTYTAAEIQLKYDMQELWIEHAWWTRSVIVSSIAGLEDTESVLARLLQNQVDIGDLFKPYYGVETGAKLTALLKEHILIAGKLIDAAKKGDQEGVAKINQDWYRNADVIVAFLSGINPNWSKKDLTDMFYHHLILTTKEVEYRLKKDWLGDINTADENEEHLIHMADFFTDGIVKQFPKKFK